MGIFGPDAPPNLMAATRRGQLSCAGLIDRYQIECAPVRDLLVDYLAVRRPAVDYTSLDNLARNLGLLFWRDLELHHPGISSLRLPSEVAAAWKLRLQVISHDPRRAGRQRCGPAPGHPPGHARLPAQCRPLVRCRGRPMNALLVASRRPLTG